jgi:hypothetical protein
VPAAYRAVFVVFAMLSAAPLLGGCADRANVGVPDARDTLVAEPVSRWRIVQIRVDRRRKTVPQPAAELIGIATTTRVFNSFRGVLEVTCYRNAPRVRIGFPFSVGNGRTLLTYTFDGGPEHTIPVRVRTWHRNIVVIREPADAEAFVAGLLSGKVVNVLIRRTIFRLHGAEFKLFGAEQPVTTALAACRPAAVAAKPGAKPAPLPAAAETASDDEDDDRLQDAIGPMADDAE